MINRTCLAGPYFMEKILLTAITSLAGVIAFLYLQIRSDQQLIKDKLEECEDDRRKLWERISELRRELEVE